MRSTILSRIKIKSARRLQNARNSPNAANKLSTSCNNATAPNNATNFLNGVPAFLITDRDSNYRLGIFDTKLKVSLSFIASTRLGKVIPIQFIVIVSFEVSRTKLTFAGVSTANDGKANSITDKVEDSFKSRF